jgi:two-component system, chemotaxis family, protein-glutamate methylesterase/glutaminase
MAIKVMIVDDSLFIRAILRHLISEDPKKRFVVTAAATDGEDALRKLKYHDVDVITMDIEMPKKNGLETTKEIMKTSPKPIIMLSSLTKNGAKETVESLALGAVDFITKPSNHVDMSSLKEEIYEKLYHASCVPQKKLKRQVSFRDKQTSPSFSISQKLSAIIAVGCSTGGPNALRTFASQLPESLPAGIVVVQHMPAGGYIESLSDHLNQISSFHVTTGKNGEELTNGKMILAPGGFHMELKKHHDKVVTMINDDPPISGLRPSVDRLFHSISSLDISDLISIYGVILTGMGSDGLGGIKDLKPKKNAIIFAESKDTAVVYGMPKKIVENGLADYTENLEYIVPKLSKHILSNLR